MSVLQLKQEITRLTKQDRDEIFAYLVRLKHETAQWRREAARRIRAMKKGRGITSEEIESRIAAP
jgi:hypothetical protein